MDLIILLDFSFVNLNYAEVMLKYGALRILSHYGKYLLDEDL